MLHTVYLNFDYSPFTRYRLVCPHFTLVPLKFSAILVPRFPISWESFLSFPFFRRFSRLLVNIVGIVCIFY